MPLYEPFAVKTFTPVPLLTFVVFVKVVIVVPLFRVPPPDAFKFQVDMPAALPTKVVLCPLSVSIFINFYNQH